MGQDSSNKKVDSNRKEQDNAAIRRSIDKSIRVPSPTLHLTESFLAPQLPTSFNTNCLI